MNRFLLSLGLLTLIYALVLASFHPWDLALGALISGALLFMFRGSIFQESDRRPPGLLSRSLAFGPFAFAVVLDVITGTWEVALVTLHLRPLARSGIVAVPIEDRTPIGMAVSALCLTISPGEVLVDVDRERGVMLIHVIDATEPEAIRERHRRFYQRYQKRVFP